MQRNLLALSTLALITAPTFVMADDLSNTWVELDYANVDIDDLDDGDVIDDFDDGSGWALRGSYGFTENFFGFGEFSDTDADATYVSEGTVFTSGSADVERLTLGLGYSIPLDWDTSRDSELRLRAAYTDIDYGDFAAGGSDGGGIDDLNEDSSDGYFVDAAYRTQLTQGIEGTLGLQYTDIEDADDVSLLAGLLFEITPNFGINLEGNIGDELGVYYLGARYSFDRF